MVVMDAMAPQTETKGKRCSQDILTQKSNPDYVAFADVIGNVAQQTQPETNEGGFPDLSADTNPHLIETGNENVPTDQLSLISSNFQKEISTSRNDMMWMAGLGSGINGWDVNGDLKMNPGNLTAYARSSPENAQIANGIANLADDLTLENLKIERAPKIGNDTLALKKEMGYSQTWQMNMGSAERYQLPEKPQQDSVSRLMRELGGHMNLKSETPSRPEIAVTEKFTVKTLPLNAVGEPCKGETSSMGMMTGQNLEIMPHAVAGAASLPTPSSLAPQVIQAIQQGAHLQPQEIKEMTLRLHPQELGKLDLLMRMEDGQIYVTIRASEMGTGQLLQNQMQDLKQNLRDAGIDANVEMDFGDQAQAQQSFKEAFREESAFKADTQLAEGHSDEGQSHEDQSEENYLNENRFTENEHAENRDNRGILFERDGLQDTVDFWI